MLKEFLSPVCPLEEAFAAFARYAPHNYTLRFDDTQKKITPHYCFPASVIEDIQATLEAIGIRQVRQLVCHPKQSLVSIPFYAGDGLVIKVCVDKFFAPYRQVPFPFQPLPLHRSRHHGYTLEIQPWLDTRKTTRAEVEALRTQLANVSLVFKRTEAMPRNIARMPGGDLMVLDYGALEPLEGVMPAWADMHRWIANTYRAFHPLYAQPLASLIRGNPDFSYGFSPLIAKEKTLGV